MKHLQLLPNIEIISKNEYRINRIYCGTFITYNMLYNNSSWNVDKFESGAILSNQHHILSKKFDSLQSCIEYILDCDESLLKHI